MAAAHAELGDRFLYCEKEVPLLFTENETNNERIFGTPNAGRYVKDGINNYRGRRKAGRGQSGAQGTKVSAHYQLTVGAGKTVTIWLRLSDQAPAAMGEPFGDRFGRNRAVPPA